MSTTSTDNFANVTVGEAEPGTPSMIDKKGGPMEIEEVNNELGEIEGGLQDDQRNDLDGFSNDIIGRETSGLGLGSYVTDVSKKSDLI